VYAGVDAAGDVAAGPGYAPYGFGAEVGTGLGAAKLSGLAANCPMLAAL